MRKIGLTLYLIQEGYRILYSSSLFSIFSSLTPKSKFPPFLLLPLSLPLGSPSCPCSSLSLSTSNTFGNISPLILTLSFFPLPPLLPLLPLILLLNPILMVSSFSLSLSFPLLSFLFSFLSSPFPLLFPYSPSPLPLLLLPPSFLLSQCILPPNRIPLYPA